VDQLESNLHRWESHKHTTHDSGVSMLDDSEEKDGRTSQQPFPPSKTTIPAHDERPSASPYNVQPAVEFIHSRLSMEGGPERTANMPAMAMKHYSTTRQMDDTDDLSTLSHFHATAANQPPGWHDGPVYCQCTIQ
jgi:hypothetical protein